MSKQILSRRQFLKIMAISGTAVGLAAKFDQNWLCNLSQNSLETIHMPHYLMGCVVNITLVSDDPAQAKMAAAAAIAEMQRLVKIFSRFDPSSQLSQLNSQGVLRSPDPALVSLLQASNDVRQASDGAFDISIKPLIDLYQEGMGKYLPASSEIQKALSKVDFSKVVIDSHEIGFSKAGMGLTLDGIAKGAVIDEGVNILRDHGFVNVIVESGGDLLASGSHGQDNPWMIGMRTPRTEHCLKLPALSVENMAVATSGDYLQAYTADYSVHHILDPRQGVSPGELASVTVLAPGTMLADALATGMMVSGISAGFEMLDQFPGCEAFLITKDLEIVSSPGLKNYLV